MTFDAAERNGRFGRIQCQRGNKSSNRGKRRVFLCRKTMKVKVRGKAISASFLKIEGRGALVGAIGRRKRKDRRIGRWSEPRSCSTSQEQERAREEGAKEMSGEERLPEKRWRKVGVSGSLMGRKSEKMSSRIFLFCGGRKYLLSPRGMMAIEVPQNEEISGGGKNEGRKGVGSYIFAKK